MKPYIITIAFLIGSILCFGQPINRAEYFIGDDPGFGLATPIPIVSSEDSLILSFLADTQLLTEGFHFINIRACDSLGKWSHPVQRIFYVFKSQSNVDEEITDVEYFIDKDPGFGLATPLTVSSPGNNITLDFTAVFESLVEGFHFLNIRARDSLGSWGQTLQRIFYVFKSQSATDLEITGIEYFIDSDPGIGKAIQVEVPSPGNDITINFDADIASLSDGDHVIYLRCKDALNRWGHMYSQGFTSIYTSIDEIKIESLFKLYPNPNNGNFYLEFSEELKSPINLNINDLSGRIMYVKEFDNRVNSLNLNLSAGIYLLNIESKDNSFTQKIIIK